MSIDDVVKEKLLSKAREAARNSYSPYSLFRVGACLLCADGSMFVGCNVENSAFSSTVCAERTAFVQAVAAGKREFKAIAVVSPDSDGLCLPCGECRQVMSEFCAEDFLILSESGGETAEFSLGGLLPRSFKLKRGIRLWTNTSLCACPSLWMTTDRTTTIFAGGSRKGRRKIQA